MVALRGARPSHRHHGDGWYDEDGRLRCRYPADGVTEFSGVITGAAVLATLGSGAIPPEVVLVVREAVLLNPYGYQWLAAAAAPAPSDRAALEARLAAEMVRLYGVDGRYDGSSHLATSIPLYDGRAEWADVSAELSIVDRKIAGELARHSLLAGTPPSPVAFTLWRQPWVPLWLEWRVRVEGTDTAAGWELDGLDLRPAAGGPAGNPVASTLVGRSPIGQGAATALHYGISRWLDAERQRDATGGSTLPPTDTSILERLGDLLGPASGVPTALDLVSASLDGIREQLLGIDYVGVIERAAGARPQAVGAPTPVFGGVLRIDALRLVDAFGRVLDVPPGAVAATASTADLAVAAPASGTGTALAGTHPGIWMRPRVQHQARWLLRLVDPAPTGSIEPREAFVDQIDPARAVNPVAGFLLPDHIDEELEAFTRAGMAIGQVAHDAVSGAVTWEPAPGRAVPPDAATGGRTRRRRLGSWPRSRPGSSLLTPRRGRRIH